MLRSSGNGTHMEMPISKERIQIVVFAFLDDTNIPDAIMNGYDVILNYIK